MSVFYLEYPLQAGYIHNWLVAGPQAVYVHDLERFEGNDYKLQIARHYHKRASDILDCRGVVRIALQDVFQPVMHCN